MSDKFYINNRLFVQFSIFFIVLLSATACGLVELNVDEKIRTVYFETNGAEAIPKQSVIYGQKVAIPDPGPVRKGYSFDGWYADPELKTPYSFSRAVIDNITLYAKWTLLPIPVRLIQFHASLQGETMVGFINEGAVPPTVTLTLQKSQPFGTDVSTILLTKVTVYPKNATTNKQVGDVAKLTLKTGKTLTVTSFDDKYSRSYDIRLRSQSNPVHAITYNGSGILGQAIKDLVLRPQDTTLKASTVAILTTFGFVMGNVVGKIQSDEYGDILFTRTHLEKTNVKPGQQLRIAYRGDTVDVAPYQPYDIRDWHDLQAMRQDSKGSYRLMNDIVFPDKGEQGFAKEGFDPVWFTGNFDGQHHTIHNFSIARPNNGYVGLFASVQSDNEPAMIRDVTIRHSGVAGGTRVGVLTGFIDNTIVQGVVVEPVSRQDHRVESTSITRCLIGGVIGGMNNSWVYAHSTTDVYADNTTRWSSGTVGRENRFDKISVGGLIGKIHANNQVTGYATGTVTGSGSGSSFKATDWSDDILIGEGVGGLVGLVYPDGFVHIYGYATGDVTAIGGGVGVGGLVGVLLGGDGEVVGYATGHVTGLHTHNRNTSNVPGIGGLVGLLIGNNSSVAGYARGSVERKDGTVYKAFGSLVGIKSQGTVTGYHSGNAGESAILPASFTNANGIDGTAITISASTTAQNFGQLTFGNATGEWTFTLSRWPAINLPPKVGGNYLPQDQPTSP